MVATNVRLTLPRIPASIHPAQQPNHLIKKINWHIGRFEWWINYIGWIVGLKNYWRMFSPVDRFNWSMVITAVHQNGEETLLPLPHQTPRTFWQKNLIDFREAKFQTNIYNNQTAQKYYAQYLCHVYQDLDNPVTAIKIDLDSVNILPPTEAKNRGVYLEPRLDKRPWGRFACT